MSGPSESSCYLECIKQAIFLLADLSWHHGELAQKLSVCTVLFLELSLARRAVESISC